MSADAIDILKQNHLSITHARQKVLDLFIKNGKALSHADVEKKVSNLFDRITVYRTLQTFTEKGIIHVIPTTDNSVKYALCKNNCSAGHHHDNHIHFICDECNKTICLDAIDIPSVKLPRGYKLTNAEMVVTGICKDCK